MSTTPVVVESGDFTYESSTASAADMIRALKPEDSKAPAPREIKRGAKGEVKPIPQPDPVSDAASTLGKRGGEVAAKARKAAEKEAKKAAAVEVEEEVETPAKGKAEVELDEDAEGETGQEERKSRAAERVKQATREAAEAKREVARERDRADRAERELQEARRAPAVRTEAPPARDARSVTEPGARTAQDPHGDPKPVLNTYDGEDAYERFVEDTSRWAARDENRKVETRQREAEGHRKLQETISGHVETFHERLTGLKKGDEGQKAGFDDFMAELPEELVSKLTPSFMIPRGEDGRPVVKAGPANLITDLIVKSSVPAEMLSHFANDMTEFHRLEALRDPDEIKYAVAKIEARLEDATAGNPSSSERPGSNPEISKARPPARPVAVSPRIANAEPGAASSFDEHYEFYEARDKAKRRRSA